MHLTVVDLLAAVLSVQVIACHLTVPARPKSTTRPDFEHLRAPVESFVSSFKSSAQATPCPDSDKPWPRPAPCLNGTSICQRYEYPDGIWYLRNVTTPPPPKNGVVVATDYERIEHDDTASLGSEIRGRQRQDKDENALGREREGICTCSGDVHSGAELPVGAQRACCHPIRQEQSSTSDQQPLSDRPQKESMRKSGDSADDEYAAYTATDLNNTHERLREAAEQHFEWCQAATYAKQLQYASDLTAFQTEVLDEQLASMRAFAAEMQKTSENTQERYQFSTHDVVAKGFTGMNRYLLDEYCTFRSHMPFTALSNTNDIRTMMSLILQRRIDSVRAQLAPREKQQPELSTKTAHEQGTDGLTKRLTDLERIIKCFHRPAICSQTWAGIREEVKTIFVRASLHMTVQLEVIPGDQVGDLMNDYMLARNVEVDQQIWILNGSRLENDRLMSDYGFANGTAVQMIRRLPANGSSDYLREGPPLLNPKYREPAGYPDYDDPASFSVYSTVPYTVFDDDGPHSQMLCLFFSRGPHNESIRFGGKELNARYEDPWPGPPTAWSVPFGTPMQAAVDYVQWPSVNITNWEWVPASDTAANGLDPDANMSRAPDSDHLQYAIQIYEIDSKPVHIPHVKVGGLANPYWPIQTLTVSWFHFVPRRDRPFQHATGGQLPKDLLHEFWNGSEPEKVVPAFQGDEDRQEQALALFTYIQGLEPKILRKQFGQFIQLRCPQRGEEGALLCLRQVAFTLSQDCLALRDPAVLSYILSGWYVSPQECRLWREVAWPRMKRNMDRAEGLAFDACEAASAADRGRRSLVNCALEECAIHPLCNPREMYRRGPFPWYLRYLRAPTGSGDN